MSSVKADASIQPAVQVPDTGASALPHAAAKVDDIRAQIAKGGADSGSAGSSLSEPQRLMNLYLTGKLSMGELAHQLKVYNSVVADTIIKEGKRAQASQIDYREVPRGSMANPGADLNPEAERHSAPKNSHDAKNEERETDDPNKRKEIEKKETELKAKESQQTVVQINLFERTNQEVKGAHHWREVHRQEKVKEEETFQNQTETPEDCIIKQQQKTTTLKERIKGSVRQMRQRMKEKLQGGAKGQGR